MKKPLTKKNRRAESRKVSAAFGAARKHLHRTDAPFICIAIRRAYDNGEIEHREYIRCKQIIKRRLGDYYTLSDWLCGQGYHIYTYTLDERSYRLYTTRIAWLDALEKEFA